MKEVNLKTSREVVNPERSRRGFALIYVLVITVIMMISITSILTLGSSDVRQKRKVLATAGAWQMAQSGLEDAISRYQADPTLCSGGWFYFNVKNNEYKWSGLDISPLAEDQGAYGFLISCSSPDTKEAIGYFKGSKVRMKADMGDDDTKWNIYQIGF